MVDAPDEAARRSAVDEALARAAGANGTLRFDRFLEVALYAPTIGYYAAQGRSLGSSGDFYTAAQVGPLLGATLARRVRTEFDRLGQPASFRVIEAAAGDGSLATAVAGAMAEDPVLRTAAIEYVLVEPSPALAHQLEQRLPQAARPPGLRWRWASAVAADGPFAGLVLANELLDALPFRRLVFARGQWLEQGVRRSDGHWRLVDVGPADPVPAPGLPPSAEEGSVREVGVLAEGWVREVADHLVRGAVIVLDYGDEEERLAARYPRGSLTAFRGHAVLEDPFDAPGSADLSAFVNFTRIKSAATRAGLRIGSYGPQSEALARWGLGEVGPAWIQAAGGDAVERVRRQLTLKNLSFGFPNFRVLELTTGT